MAAIGKTAALRFPGGMNNVSPETGLPDNGRDTLGQARRIVNLDIANGGEMVTRPGTSKVINGTNVHSLWSGETGQTFYVDAGTLTRINADMSTTAIRTNLIPGLPVSYAEVNGMVYWSNTQQQGKVEHGADAEWQPGRAGSIVRYYNSRLYIVDGMFVFPTDAMNYGKIDPFRNFFGLPADITLFEPVTGGIFAGCEGGVYFLAGADYKQFSLDLKDNLRPVPGSAVVVDAEIFGADGKACAWLTERGWVAGLPGGLVKRLTDKSLAIPKHESATAILKEQGGLRQLFAIARGGEQNIATANDTYTTEVIRNGRIVA